MGYVLSKVEKELLDKFEDFISESLIKTAKKYLNKDTASKCGDSWLYFYSSYIEFESITITGLDKIHFCNLQRSYDGESIKYYMDNINDTVREALFNLFSLVYEKLVNSLKFQRIIFKDISNYPEVLKWFNEDGIRVHYKIKKEYHEIISAIEMGIF